MQPDENPVNQTAQDGPDDANNGGLPNNISQIIPPDHPSTDTDIDSHEAYDEELDEAAKTENAAKDKLQ
jgi:hypothetical protein